MRSSKPGITGALTSAWAILLSVLGLTVRPRSAVLSVVGLMPATRARSHSHQPRSAISWRSLPARTLTELT